MADKPIKAEVFTAKHELPAGTIIETAAIKDGDTYKLFAHGELPPIKDIVRLQIREGDAVVVIFEQRLDMAHVAGVQRIVRAQLGLDETNRVMVMDQDAAIGVISRERIG